MSITINSNLADPEANSYVTVAQADSYFEKRRETTNWTNLNVTQKKESLVQACNDINRFNFINDPYYENQALPFPDDLHGSEKNVVSTPLDDTTIKNTNLTTTTYGSNEYNDDYWKYGTIHIVTATPLDDIRNVASSNSGNTVIHLITALSSTPTTNTYFRIFEPLDSSITEAQMEQALYLVDNPYMRTIYNYKNLGAEEVEIGDVKIKFRKTSSPNKVPMSSISSRLLSKWIKKDRKVYRA